MMTVSYMPMELYLNDETNGIEIEYSRFPIMFIHVQVQHQTVVCFSE